jgi:flagellar motor component MotA
MTELKHHELFTVAGGLLPAIGALIAIIAAPLLIKHHIEEYNQIGHQLGEALWEHNHPYDPNL